MKTCNKYPHQTEKQARQFQINLCKKAEWKLPFWVYRCPSCKYFHISTHGFYWKFLNEIREIILKNDCKTARFVKRLSHWRAVFDVDTSRGTMQVSYDKRAKAINVLGAWVGAELFEIVKVSPNESLKAKPV